MRLLGEVIRLTPTSPTTAFLARVTLCTEKLVPAMAAVYVLALSLIHISEPTRPY